MSPSQLPASCLYTADGPCGSTTASPERRTAVFPPSPACRQSTQVVEPFSPYTRPHTTPRSCFSDRPMDAVHEGWLAFTGRLPFHPTETLLHHSHDAAHMARECFDRRENLRYPRAGPIVQAELESVRERKPWQSCTWIRECGTIDALDIDI